MEDPFLPPARMRRVGWRPYGGLASTDHDGVIPQILSAALCLAGGVQTPTRRPVTLAWRALTPPQHHQMTTNQPPPREEKPPGERFGHRGAVPERRLLSDLTTRLREGRAPQPHGRCPRAMPRGGAQSKAAAEDGGQHHRPPCLPWQQSSRLRPTRTLPSVGFRGNQLVVEPASGLVSSHHTSHVLATNKRPTVPRSSRGQKEAGAHTYSQQVSSMCGLMPATADGVRPAHALLLWSASRGRSPITRRQQHVLPSATREGMCPAFSRP